MLTKIDEEYMSWSCGKKERDMKNWQKEQMPRKLN